MPVVEDAVPMVYVVDDDEAVRESLKLILDLHLPGASGLDYLAKQDDALAELPVIIITGRGDPASRARAERLGVIAFLDKIFPLHKSRLSAKHNSAGIPPPALG